jgi:hypothetical protein
VLQLEHFELLFDVRAIKICALSTHLFFGIDAEARDQDLIHQDRQWLRLEKSKRLLEQIKTRFSRRAPMHRAHRFWRQCQWRSGL